MSGWIILAVLLGVSVGLVWLLRVRGAMLQLTVAALLFGCAGYALQGHPSLFGSPRQGRGSIPPIPLTDFRHAFYGNFTPTEHWLLMAESFAARGNTEEAVGVLRAAIRQHPNDPQLWIGLGNALVDHSRGLTPASEFAFRRAAELTPGYPAPPFFMGLALARSGDRESAIALWKQMLSGAPADASWRTMVEDAIEAIERPPQPSER
jgi:cytochrome c-type biogenesis protein CcmH